MSNCVGLPCGGYNVSYINFSPSSTDCGHEQSCNGCMDIIKSECIKYTGSNLTNTGINQNDTLSQILVKMDNIKAIQDTKNSNLLAAINDLNTRVNTLEDGSPHPPYTLL